MKSQRQLWLYWMSLAFVANGLGPFGLKMLAGRGLAESYHYQYLAAWYFGSVALLLPALLAARLLPSRTEVLLAAVMGLGSFAGQFFSSRALEHGIPGYIVFPATTGGSLFVVPLAGILMFREKIRGYGIAGVATGTVALLLLTLS